MPFGGALTLGVIAGTSLFNGILGSNAANNAADQQTAAGDKALDFQKQMFGTEQANQAPFVAAGQSSIAQLMNDINSGKFGPSSNPNAPTAPGAFTGTFQAPTADQARATPGYQFTAEQGNKGILAGAAAAGGSISGGTLRALDSYNTGLADSTYNDTFNHALSTYGAGLQGYQANLQGYNSSLAGYQANLQKQQQEFQQLYNPAALGEGSVQAINNTGQQTSTNVGNLMTQIGNSQAAGTVGSANAVTGSLDTGVANMIKLQTQPKTKDPTNDPTLGSAGPG